MSEDEIMILELKQKKSELVLLVSALRLTAKVVEKDNLSFASIEEAKEKVKGLFTLTQMTADCFRWFVFLGTTMSQDLNSCRRLAVTLELLDRVEDHEFIDAFTEIEKSIEFINIEFQTKEIDEDADGQKLPNDIPTTESDLFAIKYPKAIELWNNGTSWPDIAQELINERVQHKSFMQCVKRFATKNKITLRKGKPGLQPDRNQ